MKVKRFWERLYNTHLVFVYDCKAIEAQDYLRKNGMGNRDLVTCTGQMGSYTVTKGKQYEQTRYYIYIEKGKYQNYVLVHEIAHLIFIALADCGIRVNQETDEIFAYYYEWWFIHLWKCLNPK